MRTGTHTCILTGALAITLGIFAAGCSDDDDDNPLGPGGDSGTLAVVMTSADDEYNLSVVDYAAGIAYTDLEELGGTSNMYQYGDYVYIVDKANDRVVKFDPVERAAVHDMSLGAGTGPCCMVFVSATKAYVTRSDDPAVAIVNPSAMTMTGSIDLSGLADGDGDPDQYDAVLMGDYLYVALRRDSDIDDYSSIAVIDTGADTLVTECELVTFGVGSSSRNCLGGRVIGTNAVAGTLYPYVIGTVRKEDDGAIEVYDPETNTTSVVMTNAAIGGNIATWVFDTATTGYGIVGFSKDWGLSRFDLDAATFTPVGPYQHTNLTWGLDITNDGLVLLSSRDEDNPGVLVLDSMNGYEPVFESPIDTGLMPQTILVVR